MIRTDVTPLINARPTGPENATMAAFTRSDDAELFPFALACDVIGHTGWSAAEPAWPARPGEVMVDDDDDDGVDDDDFFDDEDEDDDFDDDEDDEFDYDDDEDDDELDDDEDDEEAFDFDDDDDD